MYTGGGVGGKLLGLGGQAQDVVFFGNPNQRQWWDRQQCIPARQWSLLPGCFTGEPPEGADPTAYWRFCANAAEWGAFDKPPCQPEVSDFVRAVAFPEVPSCLNREQYEQYRYCMRYGYEGSTTLSKDKAKLCFLAAGSPPLMSELSQTPQCADAGCLTAPDFTAIAACFRGDCEQGQTWFSAMKSKPACSDMRNSATLPACIDENAAGELRYCARHPNFDGPDWSRNYFCWGAHKMGTLGTLLGLPVCGAEPPKDPRTPPGIAPSDPTIAPDSTAAFVDSTLPYIPPPPPLEPPPSQGPDVMRWGLIGLGALVVGGIALAATRRK